MKKGYILVDVPESCRCIRGDEKGCLFGGMMCGIAQKDVMSHVAKGTKPDWCPIREFPEKKAPSQFTASPILPCQYTEYNKGWNDCIEQMEVER